AIMAFSAACLSIFSCLRFSFLFVAHEARIFERRDLAVARSSLLALMMISLSQDDSFFVLGG
ncbi:MAG: hypothetical protein ACO3J6_11040, partial [Opitutales bacterium]